MKKIYVLICCLAVLASCRKSEVEPGSNADKAGLMGKFPDPVIDINIKGHVPSMATLETGMSFNSVKDAINKTKKSSIDIYKDSLWSSGFGRTLFVETDEIALMKNSAYERYIYAGALLQGNTIADLNFKPISEYQSAVKPITASVSFQAKKISGVINNVTLSGTRDFIRDLLAQNNVGDQVAGFSFSLEQFSAYDELKLAFGSNVKTNSLFSSKTSSSTETSVKISRRSGVYAKFIQKNFTLDLDIPAGGQMLNSSVDMNAINQQNPVYVSSITYGRMGIMAIESDYSAEETKSAYETAFKALFVKGSRTTTQEERKIINEATMKIYIIGADGADAVQSVNGYDDFIQFVSRGGQFTSAAPGVPIYFGLSHLNDHSVVKTRFRLNIETDPVYARLEYENVREVNNNNDYSNSSYYKFADVYVHFYSDMTGNTFTIPPLFVKFEYKQSTRSTGNASGPYEPYHEWDNTYADSAAVINTFKQTKILLRQNVVVNSYANANYVEDYGSGGSGLVTSASNSLATWTLKPGQFYKVLAPKF